MTKGAEPFRFGTASILVRFTGVRAGSLQELATLLGSVSGSSIFQHTYNAYLESHFAPGIPRNTFAYWTAEVLHQEALAERLAAIDPYEFTELRSIRERLIQILQSHFQNGGTDAVAPEGQEFHFLESVSVLTPTSLAAHDLVTLRESLSKVAIRSIYHHFLTARLRLGRGTNDFSVWLAESLGEGDLAKSFETVGVGTSTLEDIRQGLLRLIDKRLASMRVQRTVGFGLLGVSIVGGIASIIRIARPRKDRSASRSR